MDAGSNAIRFVAARVDAPGNWSVIDSMRAPVRLGTSAFHAGILADEVVDRAVEAFVDFRRRLDHLEIVRYRAVATSAVRDSANAADLVRRIREESGIRLEPISGAEEARLVWTAVRGRLPERHGDWVLADLGGGSLEISRASGNEIETVASLRLGTLRLLELLGKRADDPAEVRALVGADEALSKSADGLRVENGAGLVATGGNIEAIADIAQAGKAPGPAPGARLLHVRGLREAIAELAAVSRRKRMTRWSLRPDRADVIVPAGVLYERVAELVGAEHILVPDVGVKEGVLLDLSLLPSL